MKQTDNLKILAAVAITMLLTAMPGFSSPVEVGGTTLETPADTAPDKQQSRRQRKKQQAETLPERTETPEQIVLVPVTDTDDEAEADAATPHYYNLPEPGVGSDANAVSLSGLNVYDNATNLNINYTAHELDSLVAAWTEQSVSNNYESWFTDFIDLDPTEPVEGELPDSVYSQRLRSIVSPIYLGYNDIVKRYVVAYSKTRKGTISRILGLSMVYFPMIEQELAAAGLPLELKMLPVIESALNPVAVSRMGATGLWQFMFATGKHYGLEITSYVDQRRDPLLSTRAACRFLADLYAMYGDWTLAIAAYNCGPGNVNKAIKRAGNNARTFWDVYEYLPREMRGYVPAFIGATYAFHYHKQHGIEPVLQDLPLSADTVGIDRLVHLEQVSSTLGLEIETLRAFNPQYKMDIIPAVGKTYHLTLPQSQVTRFIELEPEVYAKDTIYLAQYLKKDPVTNRQEVQLNAATEYRIKSGDTLGAIARKYGVTVNQIMRWNNITNPNRLRIGQRIQINK